MLDPDTSVRDIWPVIQPKMHPLQVHSRSVQTVRDFAAISTSRELERFLHVLACQSGVISQLRQTDVLHAFEDVPRLGISLIHEHAGARLRNYPLSFTKSHRSRKWYTLLSSDSVYWLDQDVGKFGGWKVCNCDRTYMHEYRESKLLVTRYVKKMRRQIKIRGKCVIFYVYFFISHHWTT